MPGHLESGAMAILKDHGYPVEHINEALAICGTNLQQCAQYCLSKANDDVEIVVPEIAATAEEWASQTIRGSGFTERATTQALETSEFSFTQALLLLLYGQDEERLKSKGCNGFHRHLSRRTFRIDESSLNGDPVRAQYEARALADLGLNVVAVDLGQYAGTTTAACFWLALAAGLSRLEWEIPAQALLGLGEAAELLSQTRRMQLRDLDQKDAGVRLQATPVGLVAEQLRKYMCAGDDAVLLRRDVVDRLYPAFAALDTNSARRQLPHYKQWVAKLATKEYADELIVLAVALELRIRIVCVPYIPRDSPRPWVITTYGPPDN